MRNGITGYAVSYLDQCLRADLDTVYCVQIICYNSLSLEFWLSPIEVRFLIILVSFCFIVMISLHTILINKETLDNKGGLMATLSLLVDATKIFMEIWGFAKTLNNIKPPFDYQ